MVQRVVLGITGGIAAYKSAELARLLQQGGVDVRVVMTEAATRFVTPATFQALTGHPVYTDLWDDSVPSGMAHIELSRGADAVLVAPASADFVAKLAHGLADDLLSTLCLARECPLWVAPAMNRQMWEHPATARNVAQLRADGVGVLGPAQGDQACGETGFGRMLEPEELAEAIVAALQPKPLAGVTALITAGPTFEAIDPVRGVTNRSSGKMGFALARALAEAGARVTLVAGPVVLPTPFGVERVDVTGAQAMFEAVKARAGGADVFVGVAAVADYRPAATSKRKLKRSGEGLTLELTPNPDILGYVAKLPGGPFCVAFAAETERLDEHATDKLRRKGVPLLVANLAQAAIGADDNEVVLFDSRGRHPLPRSDKLTVARAIVGHLAPMLPPRGAGSRARVRAVRG
jgi:phosphopantothenoylcysteine decarboxylase/phosphopantothenate--cysteine ligase